MTFHLPAEWENQKAVWLSFPHNAQNWRGKNRERIFDFYLELIEICSRFEPVNVLVEKDFALPETAERIFDKSPFKPQFIPIETDDVWIRDYGPFFVYGDDGKERIFKFGFNAWGRKFPPWNLDEKIPFEIAQRENLPVEESPYIFEGGAIEVNGDGLGITTHPCLTGNNRNPERERENVEAAIKEALGLKDLLVLPQGLAGDHTDGHIDNAARFISKTRVAVAWESDRNSPNFPALSRNKLLIEAWLQKHYGERAVVDAVQIPTQKRLGRGTLPASYMNFIFLNGAIVFPKYEKGFDEKAEAYFKSAFPDRQVVGIDATSVIRQGGSLHCISKQEGENPG